MQRGTCAVRFKTSTAHDKPQSRVFETFLIPALSCLLRARGAANSPLPLHSPTPGSHLPPSPPFSFLHPSPPFLYHPLHASLFLQPASANMVHQTKEELHCCDESSCVNATHSDNGFLSNARPGKGCSEGQAAVNGESRSLTLDNGCVEATKLPDSMKDEPIGSEEVTGKALSSISDCAAVKTEPSFEDKANVPHDVPGNAEAQSFASEAVPDYDDEFSDDDNKGSLVTDEMKEEERRLGEVRAKEDAEKELNTPPPKLGDAMFNKLDELLSKTQLYSEFLLEKMDDIALASVNAAQPSPSSANETKKGGRKRKATNSLNAGRKKAKVAVEAMLANHKEDDAKQSSHEVNTLSEEEQLLKEQMEIAPLFTGGRLKSYQLKGVKWMISLWQNGLNGILADQMGLGKTVQTIAFLAHLKGMGMDGPFMICAPLSTLSNWVNEVKRFVPTMEVLLYHGSKPERTIQRRKFMPSTITPSFPLIVTSYEVAINDCKFLRKYQWKYVVVDEGHRLKNFDCKLLRELKQLPTDNKLLLTGTPLQNNLRELWSLLNFILPQIFTSLSEFQSWFDFAGKNENAPEDGNDQQRLQVISKLHLILRPFLLRRLKQDVEKSLPGKKEIILYAPMSNQQKEFHESLLNKTLAQYLEENLRTASHVTKAKLNNLVMQLRKNCNHPDLLTSQFEVDVFWPPIEKLLEQCGKLKLLDRLLEHLKRRNHKVLIFSQMTKVLDILEYYLEQRGYKSFRIDGGVHQIDRQNQIQEFNSSVECNIIFLLSTRAGGLGINLTAADTAIIYDSDWNPHMDMQAMDRCHRIGQTRPVHVYRLATSHSIECRMLKIAADKLKLEHLVIEKGQFKQERDHPKITVQESDLLALLRQERDEEEELVQSSEISEENLLKLLERSDLVQNSETKSSLPLKGPGWEVVVRTGQSNVLSSIEGYN